jgi:hypothetical protein
MTWTTQSRTGAAQADASDARTAEKREAKNQKRREMYLTRKLAGVCVDCQAGLQSDDGLRCVECNERDFIRQRKYLRSERGRLKTRARERALYHRDVEASRARRRDGYQDRKVAGVCPRCTSPALPDHTLCERHRKKLNKANRLYRKRKREGVTVLATVRRRKRKPSPKRHPGTVESIWAYQPADVLKNAYRYRLLTAMWWLDWVNTKELFDVAGVDDDPRSTDRNSAQIALARIVKFGLVEKRNLRGATFADYRITDRGRAEVARYRTGDLKRRGS